ncbi:hypothetical protein G5C66_06330 [Nocardioides sp. KC13]|uniref:ESX-1 secretion-associated protein n=1 Tax=Nocardioides turkmenicus TaxID=2711220 RepID=A0A6M1R3S2_9ACTN|nr:hypothetical protein [Nocardioides sp. KC13]NGN92358.1 hypothetical protein [Nocardioides sp. KC13]
MSGPTNSIYVEAQALYNCAYAWREDACGKIKEARNKASQGEGQGHLFGVLLASLQEPHDHFVASAADVLTTAASTVEGVGDAVERAAKDFEETDANTAEMLKKAEAGI